MREPLPESEAQSLGLRDAQIEADAEVNRLVREDNKEKYKCEVCQKMFKGPEFVKKHIYNKHADAVDEIKNRVCARLSEARAFTLSIVLIAALTAVLYVPVFLSLAAHPVFLLLFAVCRGFVPLVTHFRARIPPAVRALQQLRAGRQAAVSELGRWGARPTRAPDGREDGGTPHAPSLLRRTRRPRPLPARHAPASAAHGTKYVPGIRLRMCCCWFCLRVHVGVCVRACVRAHDLRSAFL